MYKLIILAVGQLKDKNLQTICSQYQKRLSSFYKLDIIELKAESFSAKSQAKAQNSESEKILNFLKKHAGSFIVVCDETGKQFSSTEISKQLEKINQPIVFVIGGSQGLTDEVRRKADLLLAFSKMTLPHELFRAVLLEQLYRAATISKGIKYHY